MTSIEKATVYADEALLLRWGDSSTNGRTLTLQLQEHGEHPFRGLPSGKNGQRVMIAVTLIGDDEQPAAPADVKRDKSPADKAIAKAHILASDEEFAAWINPGIGHVLTAEGVLDDIRAHCAVNSTTQFRTNPAALKAFEDLVWEYEHRQMVRP